MCPRLFNYVAVRQCVPECISVFMCVCVTGVRMSVFKSNTHGLSFLFVFFTRQLLYKMQFEAKSAVACAKLNISQAAEKCADMPHMHT